jgi:hypothetical protein
MQTRKTIFLWRAFFVTVIFAACCGFASTAQDCKTDVGFWNDHSGRLGETEIQLSYFTGKDGVITGNYRFIKNEKLVYSLRGKQNGCNFSFTAYDNNNGQVGSFTFIKTADNFNGNYTAADGTTSTVTLEVRSAVGGSVSQRYFELFGTTEEVDSFAMKIKTAFINNDKKWLAAHCRYPLNIYAGSPKAKLIKDQQSFINSYNKLFNKAWLDKFKKMKCYNMFSNHMGASMGRGEVWMNHSLVSTADKYEYCITGLELF